MALADNGNGLSAADVAAVMGNGYNGGFGTADGSFWLLILFLFAFMGNGWGNGFGGGYGGGVGNEVQRGFDQQAIMSGFAASTAAQADLLQAVNGLAMNMQNCCCDTRSGIADLKYTVATENCADRTALQQGVQDIISNATANNQMILDKLCQLELDGVKQRNADLLAENNALKFATSQSEQTAQILANNAAQTQALEQYLNPAPIPAYVVQNPNCCATGSYCGCGV